MRDKSIILRELKNSLQSKLKNPVRDVILFGSYAKGCAKEDSDFDILILLKDDYSWKDENNILDVCYEIDLKYNIIIDAHLMSIRELSTLRGKQPVFVNAINKGIYA